MQVIHKEGLSNKWGNAQIFNHICEEAVSHLWLCTRSLLNSLYMRKILFSFLSVHLPQLPHFLTLLSWGKLTVPYHDPPAQWNLRGGRWSSVEYCTCKKNPANLIFYLSLRYLMHIEGRLIWNIFRSSRSFTLFSGSLWSKDKATLWRGWRPRRRLAHSHPKLSIYGFVSSGGGEERGY